jgi:hypothetical protein
VYPFAHNVLLAARDRGLGGVLVLGYPQKVLTRLRRAPVEAFTKIDRYDGSPFFER